MTRAPRPGNAGPVNARLSLLRTVGITAAGTAAAVAVASTFAPVQALDDALERAAGRVRPRLRRAGSVGTLPGEPWAHWSIGTTVALVILARRRRRGWAAVLPMAGASLAGIVAHHAVKLVYRRPRPRYALQRGKTEPAFPSGHTTDSTAVLATGAYLLVREELLPARLAVPAATTLALTTGASRVALGMHWGTDVIGGWLAGLSVASGCAYLYEQLARVSCGGATVGEGSRLIGELR